MSDPKLDLARVLLDAFGCPYDPTGVSHLSVELSTDRACLVVIQVGVDGAERRTSTYTGGWAMKLHQQAKRLMARRREVDEVGAALEAMAADDAAITAEVIDVPDWRGIADQLAEALEVIVYSPRWGFGMQVTDEAAAARKALKARAAAMGGGERP